MSHNPGPLSTSGAKAPEAAPSASGPSETLSPNQQAESNKAVSAARAHHHRAHVRSAAAPAPIEPEGLGPWARAALHLQQMGLSPIPLVYRHKHPLVHAWTAISIRTRAELELRFPSRGRGNIGIRLGSAGWWPSETHAIVDVDIDSNELLARADGVLPQTPWVFGRVARPRSHRLYLVRIDTGATVKPRRWTSNVGLGCLAELRGDGQQTMAPGSVHPDGSAVVWQPEDGDMGQLARGPAQVELETLVDALTQLTGQLPDGEGGNGVPATTPPPGPRPLPARSRAWVVGVLGSQARRVRAAEPGKRNCTLFVAALNIGSLAEWGLMDRAIGGRALVFAAEGAGLPRHEATATVESGFRAAAKQPVPLDEIGGGWRGEQRVPYPPSPPGTQGLWCSPESPPPLPPQPLQLATFEEIDSRPLEWLWHGVLPLGKLVCLCGEPGLGKSFVVADIAARVSRGLEGREPSGVIILNAEDDPADTTRPRLEAAGDEGADLSRVMCVRVTPSLPPRPPARPGAADSCSEESASCSPSARANAPDTDSSEQESVAPGGSEENPPAPHFDLAMWETLDATLAANPQVRLVCIDPVSAFFPDHRDSHKQSDVRRVLAPLTRIAQQRNATVLLIAHLNKDSAMSDVHRVSGSTALAAACRAVWIVKRVGKEEDGAPAQERSMTPAKLNLAPDACSLRFRVVNGRRGPRVEWE